MKGKVPGLLAAAMLAGPMGAGAVDLNLDSSGVLVGARGVQVDGSLYDVDFVTGTCIALFSGCDDAGDFTFRDAAGAEAASNALLSDVFTGIYDTDPSLTYGCTTRIYCLVITPYALSMSPFDYVQVDAFAIQNGTDINVVFPGWLEPTGNANGGLVYARWTRQVPEPGTLALLGLGVAGLGLSRRRKAN